MDCNGTGAAIRRLRKEKRLTQAQLAARLGVSPKTISKWETGKGLPDVSLLDALAAALEVSMTELMTGAAVVNQNISANMLRSKLHVCPVCGNILHAMGDAVISCCGGVLSPLKPAPFDEAHSLTVIPVEDELYVAVNHEMTRAHSISFLAYVTTDRFSLVKLYPEGASSCRFKRHGTGLLFAYCSRHGLMKKRFP